MALINCPECGKEISDKVKVCPHCGFPFENENQGNLQQSSNIVTKKKVKKSFIIIPIIFIIVISIVGGLLYYNKIVKPKYSYNEAINMLNNGAYDKANKLLDNISDYKDVSKIKKELVYESYAYSSINSLKKNLKNPDSFVPYEINFYNVTTNKKDRPICIMHYGAQNGFGGNTTGYSIFGYDVDTKEYAFFGSCDSLDESEYDSTDEDDKIELAICKIIKKYQNDKQIGNINMKRLKKVLKNDAYSTIKIIK